MGSITEILNRAKLRVEDMNLPYEGALLPTEALTLLQENPDARLVDVRSQAEWSWVGRIPGAVAIEWQSFPDMQVIGGNIARERFKWSSWYSGGVEGGRVTMGTKLSSGGSGLNCCS